MKFYCYIFYRIKSYYNYKESQDNYTHAFIVLGSIFLIHTLTLIIWLSKIINFDIGNSIRTGNGYIDRFIVYPIAILPLFILLFVYYKKNKEKISQHLDSFKEESDTSKRRRGLYVVLYLVFSYLLLIATITSPVWLK